MSFPRKLLLFPAVFSTFAFAIASQASVAKFQQLDELLPSPNAQRTASGAPGAGYWQQRADYDIALELDEVNRSISGSAWITYRNYSPDTLSYLWVALDRNFFAADADNRLAPRGGAPTPSRFTYAALERLLAEEVFDGGVTIHHVKDEQGEPLPHTIVRTMMRIDLPEPLAPGEAFRFSIGWDFLINDAKRISTRTGYEEFDHGIVYAISKWFPRMAAYTDYGGWQNKQYLGTGEFTLEFGDYNVRITVPDDHVVAATGQLQNAAEVLTEGQRERLAAAERSERPVFIITPEEAEVAEQGEPAGRKTWVFRARNVRDFAFASSRAFVWDAMAVPGQILEGRPVMAMSLYPRDGLPLWDKYSTHAIAHTIEVFSRHTFPYPYPVAISILGGVGSGMEYPMICFNGPRPEKDGTYSARTKYGLISVVIHEVGHNYFPMIVNSDEREWMWMDEGLTSFLQYLTEQEWEENYPSRRGVPANILSYMGERNRAPVMISADTMLAQGNNAYGQPAIALNILREVVLGRELFDHAFRTYAQRWMFKRPTPADFFRTMEDASGLDLDWFWRGWFYSTDHVDVSIDQVRRLILDSRDPEVEKPREAQRKKERPATLAELRNADLPRRVEAFPELRDFYNEFDEHEVTEADRRRYRRLIKELEEAGIDPELLKTDRNIYLIDFRNVGGMVTPLILELSYTDGSTEELVLPAEIWRYNTEETTKLILTEKELARVVFDPREELTDTDVENNHWPRRAVETPFQLYRPTPEPNPMREAKKKESEAESDSK